MSVYGFTGSLPSRAMREKTTLQTGYYFFHWDPCNATKAIIECLSELRFNTKSIFLGCLFYATVMYWCGVTSIAHLTVISVERCVTIISLRWSVANRTRVPVCINILIMICWTYGLISAMLPLLGESLQLVTVWLAECSQRVNL